MRRREKNQSTSLDVLLWGGTLLATTQAGKTNLMLLDPSESLHLSSQLITAHSISDCVQAVGS